MAGTHWIWLAVPAFIWGAFVAEERRRRQPGPPAALLDLDEAQRRMLRRAENAIRQVEASGCTREEALERTRASFRFADIRLNGPMVDLLLQAVGPWLEYPYPSLADADAFLRHVLTTEQGRRSCGREHVINRMFNVGLIDFPTAQALWVGMTPTPAPRGAIGRVRARLLRATARVARAVARLRPRRRRASTR